MENKIQQEIEKIAIPENLHARSRIGVAKAKSELQPSKKKFQYKGVLAAAGLLTMIGGASFIGFLNQQEGALNAQPDPIMEQVSVEIPAMDIPEDDPYALTVSLIVYDNRIYTRAETKIGPEEGKQLLGEKLGTTKDSIDEWSGPDAFEQDFASTIGVADVYAVKGYDTNFRLMTYQMEDGKYQAYFYENLNGITVANGKDVFGKLKMVGNTESAEYRLFSDWDYDQDSYRSVNDSDALQSFLESLNNATPYSRINNSEPMNEQTRNNENFRELVLHLKNGSKVNLILIKGGYVYYGFQDIYFQVNEDEFSAFWKLLEQ